MASWILRINCQRRNWRNTYLKATLLYSSSLLYGSIMDSSINQDNGLLASSSQVQWRAGEPIVQLLIGYRNDWRSMGFFTVALRQ